MIDRVRGNACHRGYRSLALVLLAAVLPCATAAAQIGDDTLRTLEQQLRELDVRSRFIAAPDQPIQERALIDYGASLRMLVVTLEDENDKNTTLRRSEAAAYLRAELDGAHRFFGRLRLRHDDWSGGNRFEDRDDGVRYPLGDRYWYQFDLRGYRLSRSGESPPYNLNLKIGKQYLQWQEGVTYSNAVEGALLDLEWKGLALTGLAGRTPELETVDFDSTRPSFDRKTQRDLLGATLQYRGFAAHRPYLYVLDQRDRNDRDFAQFTNETGARYNTFYDYDSTYLGAGSRGSLSRHLTYRFEAVREFGRGLSSPIGADGSPIVQTREDVDAWAGLVGLSYLFLDEEARRIDFALIAGSGDRDRLDATGTFAGNRSGTDDHAFNSLGYVYTGLALAPELTNLLTTRLGYNTAPFAGGRPLLRRLRVGVDGYLFHKLRSDAPISVASTDNTFVGGEVDLSLDWNLTSDVSLNLRGGLFLPGAAIPSDRDDPRTYFLMGVTYGF